MSVKIQRVYKKVQYKPLIPLKTRKVRLDFTRKHVRAGTFMLKKEDFYHCSMASLTVSIVVTIPWMLENLDFSFLFVSITLWVLRVEKCYIRTSEFLRWGLELMLWSSSLSYHLWFQRFFYFNECLRNQSHSAAAVILASKFFNIYC